MKNKPYIYILILSIGVLYSLTNCTSRNKSSKKTTQVSYDSILSPKLLNSERIKMKYGSYDIKVLKSDSILRISNLYSSYNDKKITRTFAVVNYPEIVDSIFLKEHTKILDGQSIGKVFKQHQWEIEKKSIFFGEIIPSKDYVEIYTLMGNIAPSRLAIHIYGFYIKKGNNEHQYATIAEIYHPDYLSLNDLKQINKDAGKYLEKTVVVTQILKQVTDQMKIESLEL